MSPIWPKLSPSWPLLSPSWMSPTRLVAELDVADPTCRRLDLYSFKRSSGKTRQWMSTHVCVAIILSRNAIAKNVRLTAPVPSSATQPRTCVPTQSPQYLIWLRFRAECAMLLRVPATSRRAVSENEDLPSGHVNNNTRRWVCLPASYLPNTGSISKATRCTQLCFGLVLFLI